MIAVLKIIGVWIVMSVVIMSGYMLGFSKGYNQREKDAEDEKYRTFGI